MHCDTVKTGVECSFMSKNGCGFIGGACRTLAEKCEGCERVIAAADAKYCAVFPDPQVKWRLGNCNMATHIKVETKGADSKVRVGQQKQKKKK
ncbi:MAG: PxxKW family cysteine-rich protein [Deltaproteobacteria bacterium]|nr:PxxKW family cysteine-rich protein [Deltaproteobacteria bacterium]